MKYYFALIILLICLLSGCRHSYVGLSREDIISVVNNNKRCSPITNGKIFIQVDNCSNTKFFDSIKSLRQDKYTMGNSTWGILPFEHVLWDGYFVTKLYFKDDVVYKEEVRYRGFGGPFEFLLYRLFYLFH